MSNQTETKKLKMDETAVAEMFGKAISCGFLEKVQSMVKDGTVDPSSTQLLFEGEYGKKTLLAHATEPAMVEYLIGKGAVVDEPAISSCFDCEHDLKEHIPKLKILLKCQPGQLDNAWSHSFLCGNVAVVQFLLGSYSISQDKIKEGLFQPHVTNNPELVKLLLASGADVNDTNEKGETLLMMALNFPYNKDKCTETIKVLFDHGLQNIDGALHRAASKFNGSLNVIKLLLEKGADVNATNASGETPLHLTNNANCALFLVHMGADIYQVSNSGRLAMENVVYRNQDENLRQTLVMAETSRSFKRGMEVWNKQTE